MHRTPTSLAPAQPRILLSACMVGFVLQIRFTNSSLSSDPVHEDEPTNRRILLPCSPGYHPHWSCHIHNPRPPRPPDITLPPSRQRPSPHHCFSTMCRPTNASRSDTIPCICKQSTIRGTPLYLCHAPLCHPRGIGETQA